MEINRHVPFPFDRRDRANVIDVGVRDPDGFERGAGMLDRINQALAFTAWIDDDCAFRAVIDQEITVLLKRADRDGLYVHRYFAGLPRNCVHKTIAAQPCPSTLN